MAYLGQDLVLGQQRYSPSFYSSIPFLKAVKLETIILAVDRRLTSRKLLAVDR